MNYYPSVMRPDEQQQLLAQTLGQFKPGQLGAAPTLGNEQAQQDYVRQLADALAQMKSAQSQQESARALMSPEYIPNSGGLGALAMIAQAYAGKKMGEKAGKREGEASTRALTAQSLLEEAKAEREARRKIKAAQDEQAQRRKDGEAAGLTGRDLTRYALEGKMGEGVRGVPMMTDQGLVNVDPYTGQAAPITQGQPQQRQIPPNVKIDGVDPADMEAVFADIARNAPAGDQSYNLPSRPQGGAQSGPLMPYEKPPTPIEVEKLRLAQEAAARDARESELKAADRIEATGEKRNKAQASAMDAYDTYQDSIDAIKALRSSEGYQDVGTAYGDIAGSIPYVRPAVKDSMAKLETIKAQMLINTLGKLKAMSATGASGFGALNQSEGDAIKQAVGNLEAAQSHKSLDQALTQVQTVMERSAARIRDAGGLDVGEQSTVPKQSSGPRPGDVESGYRFKGGNPADKSNWEPVR